MANPGMPGAAEALARSYVKESVRPAAGLSREQQMNRSVGLAVRDRYKAKKDTDPIAALRPLAESGVRFNTGDQIRRRIGTEATPLVDARGVPTPEGARFAHVQGNVDMYQAVADRGFDGAFATPAERDGFRDNFVVEVLDKRPAFAALSPEEKRSAAETMLRDDRYKQIVGELLKTHLNPDTKLNEKVTKALVEAKKGFDEAESAYRGKQREVTENGRQIGSTKLALEDFADNSATGAPNGAKFDEMSDLSTREASNEAYVNTLKYDIINADVVRGGAPKTEEQMQSLREAVKGKIARGEPLAAGDEFDMGELINTEGELSRLNELRSEQRDLSTKLTEMQDKRTELLSQRAEAQNRRNEAENKFTDARDQKALEEIRFAKQIDNIMAEAGNQFITQDSEARFKAYNEYMEESMKQAGDKDAEHLLGRMRKRWTTEQVKKPLFGKETTVYKPIKGKIEADYRRLINEGPESLLREMLYEEVRSRRGISPQERDVELARIDERLRTDKAFVDKMSVEVGMQTIMHKAQIGRIYEGELKAIVQYTTWGQEALSQAVDLQAKTNADIKNFVDQFGGKGSLFSRLSRTHSGLGLIGLLLAGYTFAGSWAEDQSLQAEGLNGYQQAA